MIFPPFFPFFGRGEPLPPPLHGEEILREIQGLKRGAVHQGLGLAMLRDVRISIVTGVSKMVSLYWKKIMKIDGDKWGTPIDGNSRCPKSWGFHRNLRGFIWINVDQCGLI